MFFWHAWPKTEPAGWPAPAPATHDMTHDSAQHPPRHVPVLLAEAMACLAPQAGGVYVDATFGAGGYARAILQVPGTRLFAIDRDPHAIAAGQALAEEYPDRLVLLQGRFSGMEELLAAHGVERVDGVVMDLGVSSMQLEAPARGFSFLREGPLDMRMEAAGLSAAEVLNTFREEEIADILKTYGEERRARPIARAVVRRRKERPFRTTFDLVEVVEEVMGAPRPGRKHPATRTFQALRIFVNRELEEVARGLMAAERLLKPGGRLVVVSFHSLEDRIVKRFFAMRTGRGEAASRRLPHEPEPVEPSFVDLAPGGIAPSAEEIARNPRARSARLRAGERTQAPAIGEMPPLPGLRADERSAGRREVRTTGRRHGRGRRRGGGGGFRKRGRGKA